MKLQLPPVPPVIQTYRLLDLQSFPNTALVLTIDLQETRQLHPHLI